MRGLIIVARENFKGVLRFISIVLLLSFPVFIFIAIKVVPNIALFHSLEYNKYRVSVCR